MALHYYHADMVRTTNGVLNITTEYRPTTFKSAEDDNFFVEIKTRTKPFSSGLVQSWNKFCFTGGIVEIRARLPGNPRVGGLWPAMWLLGALARATYVASTDWIWPWSYDKCDRTRQYTQEINGCEPAPHYGLTPNMGRGAPEIDILEVMPGSGTLNYGLTKPYWSTSYQVAPGKLNDRPVDGKRPAPGQWYDDQAFAYGRNTSINAFFYGTELKHIKKRETYVADALSANTPIGATHFADFHTYRLEWEIEPGHEGLRWYLDGEFIYEIRPEALGLTGSKMPDEPMHILLNTAVSSTWGFPLPWDLPPGCDQGQSEDEKCYDCGDPKCMCRLPPGMCDMLPAHYEIDSVRVYQRTDYPGHKIGCSTDTHPTKRFIEGHLDRYYDAYNDEKRPLEPVPTGGARCRASTDCGDGVCENNKCSCTPLATGPTCMAFAAFDDVSTDGRLDCRRIQPTGAVGDPLGPHTLQAVCTAHAGDHGATSLFCCSSLTATRCQVFGLLAVTIGLVVTRVLGQRKARSASLISSSIAAGPPRPYFGSM